MNSQEEINKIYQAIVDFIWSIFPDDGAEAIYNAQIFEEDEEYNFHWFDKNGDEGWYDLDDYPDEVTDKIMEQLKLLQKHELFKKEQWTHCKVVVTDDYKLNIKFAYISQDNSWPDLYMKGISDLSYEEADDIGVPKKDWEKQVKLNKK